MPREIKRADGWEFLPAVNEFTTNLFSYQLLYILHHGQHVSCSKATFTENISDECLIVWVSDARMAVILIHMRFHSQRFTLTKDKIDSAYEDFDVILCVFGHLSTTSFVCLSFLSQT